MSSKTIKLKTILESIINEETNTIQGIQFDIFVDVNKNVTKKGIKIQLVPKGQLDSFDYTLFSNKIQKILNEGLKQYNMEVDKDTDIGLVDKNILSYLISIEWMKEIIINILKNK